MEPGRLDDRPLPLVRGGRPLKAWTWVGAFGADFMLCAARVRVGGVPVAWWAVWDRARGVLLSRDARGSGGVDVGPRHLRIRGRAVQAELQLGDGVPVEVVSPHGRQEIWTRKRAGVPASGTLTIEGAPHTVSLRAVVDESAGHHARHTAWRWSAGVGTVASGAAVAWNLVDGIHDGEPSERAVWIDGEPHPVGPVEFAPDLSWVAPRGGPRLAFAAEAPRARRENLLLARSSYEAPFGSFSGVLPIAGPLATGFGVMERHDVRW